MPDCTIKNVQKVVLLKVNQKIECLWQILVVGAKMLNKHYQIPLSFRYPNIQLPNNRYQAWQRSLYLRKRFNKNKDFENDYIIYVEEIISKG